MSCYKVFTLRKLRMLFFFIRGSLYTYRRKSGYISKSKEFLSNSFVTTVISMLFCKKVLESLFIYSTF